MSVYAIVLAAGNSSRMGEAKLLLPWHDKTVLHATLSNLKTAALPTVVVTGAYRSAIESIAHKVGFGTVYNPQYAEGEMLSSLQAGVRALPTDATAALVMLGDMPMIDPVLLRQLADRFTMTEQSIVAPTFGGRRGHPVVFGRTHFPALLALRGHAGESPRNILQTNQDAVLSIPVDSEAVLIDLDTKSAYHHWRRQTGQLESSKSEFQPETQHMSRQFQALVIEQPEPKQFTRSVQMRSTDDLPEGDLLIRVAYSSLNYKDGLSAIGNRGVTRNFPHTPGIDAAGTVAESHSAEFSEGDEVVVIGYDLGMNTSGGFGQYIRVPSGWVSKLPDGLTQRETMIIGTAGYTAAMSVEQLVKHDVKPNDGPILVTGATGGVGSVAVKLLAQLGYKVTAATGKVDSASDYLQSLGASAVVSRDEVTDTSRPLHRTRWAGVVDTVGGPMLETALAMTQPLGTVAVCGNVASGDVATTVYPFILRGITMVGIDSGNFPIERRRALWQQLGSQWKLTDIEDLLAREVSLHELGDEIDKILAGQQTGRVLVKLGS